MSELKQTRRDLNNHEIPLLELLKSTLSALDDINVFAFSGKIPVREDEKGLLKLFTEKEGKLRLRSFPLSDLDAQEIYHGAVPYGKDGKLLGGRVLTADRFGLTGVPTIPSWILNRVSGQYSSPIEYRMDGLFALGVGDSVLLPNDKSTEYDEECSYIDPSTNIKYYTSFDINERAGTLLISLPTRYTGGEFVISKPVNTEDGMMLSGTMDWSSVDGEEWDIKYCYFNPPARAIISPVEEGTMLFLQYHIWVNDEAEYLKSVEVDQQVGKDVIKQRLLGIINNGSILKEGGKIGFGLNGYYDNWVEELEDEDEAANEDNDESEEPEEKAEANNSETEEEQMERWSKKYQQKPPRTVTSEEEARLISELPGKLKGVDKLLLDTLSEMGLNWHFEGVYSSPSDDEDDVEEVKEEVSEPDIVDGEDGGAAEEVVGEDEKLEDPTKQTDMWTSPSFYAIQGETISDSRSVGKALLEKGVKKAVDIYWINIPTYYNNGCWYKHEVNQEDQDESNWDAAVYNTVSVGVAIIIELPSKV
ncbi:uncharacterized protein L199_004207 [Kwoniella botswanensis]|uniref:uncharacterized protein n=1 Tax=Kwoniella botswanensis TaxID=1268659 RepID=UPI00315DA540